MEKVRVAVNQPGDSDAEADGNAGQPSRAPRDSLLLQARAFLGDDPTEISLRVRNLSAGGLMADCGPPCAPGDAILIELRGVGAVRGHVAWRTHGRIGVAFDAPIDPLRARRPVAPPPRQDKAAAIVEQMRRPGVRTRLD